MPLICHRDHLVVCRSASRMAAARGLPLAFYEDLPYAARLSEGEIGRRVAAVGGDEHESGSPLRERPRDGVLQPRRRREILTRAAHEQGLIAQGDLGKLVVDQPSPRLVANASSSRRRRRVTPSQSGENPPTRKKLERPKSTTGLGKRPSCNAPPRE
jgi:hypothetical protein